MSLRLRRADFHFAVLAPDLAAIDSSQVRRVPRLALGHLLVPGCFVSPKRVISSIRAAEEPGPVVLLDRGIENRLQRDLVRRRDFTEPPICPGETRTNGL